MKDQDYYLINKLLKAKGFPMRLIKENTEAQKKCLKGANTITNIIENPKDFDKSLILVGETGTGKTRSMVYMAKKITEKGLKDVSYPLRSMLWVQSDDLIGKYLNEKEKLLSIDLLFVDDLGDQYTASNQSIDLLSTITNNVFRRRYFDEKITVMSTNLKNKKTTSADNYINNMRGGMFSSIESKLGKRFTSFMKEGCKLIDFGNKDYRNENI